MIMNKKIYAVVLSTLLIGIIIGFFIQTGNKNEFTKVANPSPTPIASKQTCIGDGCLSDGIDFPVGTLPADIKESLLRGLDDEYKAYATYKAVMDSYGNIRPFIMIARAETQHIASIQALFEKYGVQIPENPYLGKIVVPGSIQASCAVGVKAEIENVALYKNDLLPKVAKYPDITQVFTNLMNASEQKHLPAFQNCE